MFKKIDRIIPYLSGFVAHGEKEEGGGKLTANIAEVRAAIVEPVNDQPCYYLICGMLDRKNMYEKRPVLYVTEAEDQSANRMFKSLMDDCKRLSVQVIYANRENEGFYGSLWRFRGEYEANVNIQPAISGANIEYGDALIRESIRDKALVMPKQSEPVILQQLRQLGDIGYDENNKPNYPSFYAYTALRYLLAGFQMRPPVDRRLADNDKMHKAFELDSRRPKTQNNMTQWAV